MDTAVFFAYELNTFVKDAGTVLRCNCCGETFRQPDVRRYRENLDGERGWQDCVDYVCPYCGEDDFEEVEDDAVSD